MAATRARPPRSYGRLLAVRKATQGERVDHSSAWRAESYEPGKWRLEQEACQAYESGLSWEPILQHLRAQGCGIIDCIKIVRHITNCTLRDAKVLVHESEAWSDLRAQNEEFHEQLWKVLEEETAVLQEAEHSKDEFTSRDYGV